MILYDDQTELVERVRVALSGSQTVLMVSPTGSGKTAMALNMVRRVHAKGKRCGFTVPRRDLLEQTSDTFASHGIAHTYVASGKVYTPNQSLYICMTQTMARRVKALPDLDILFIDEAHYGEGDLDKVISEYRKRGTYILGLSATPWTLSGKGLGRWYNSMVVGKSTRWLMDNGRLSDFRYFAGKVKPDLSKVPLSNGDYAQKKLADFMEHQGAIIGDCVSDYRERCEGTRHIVRCCSIAHSQKVAQAFRDVGYAFVHVDGTTPADERKRIFKAYASGEVLGLCYAELLNFGFDLAQAAGVPDVCIESASDLRPTKSLAGIMQFWGRALRKKDKPAVIIDRVNNFVEHGFPDSERDWDLSDRKQSKKVERNAEYVRQCPKCYEVHRPQPRCPACEYLYTPEERKIDEYEGETEELDRQMREQMKEALRLQARREQGMARDYPSLYALGVKRGYSNPSAWAYQVLASRRKHGRS